MLRQSLLVLTFAWTTLRFRFAVTGWIASADDKTFNKDTEAMRIQKGKY